jgi:hypothetical protein
MQQYVLQKDMLHFWRDVKKVNVLDILFWVLYMHKTK